MPKQLPALLRVRTLGVIPSAPDRLEVVETRNSASTTTLQPRLELATLHAKGSAIAESFRAALASIMVEDDTGYRPKVILVTSAVPREGKTVVCCNLALAMAEAGRKVLLIDVDMRRPRIDDVFSSKPQPNLVSVIGRAELQSSVDQLTQPTEVENLRVLPCGLANGQATGILYSDGLKRLLDWARGEFQAVFIDAPPLNPFSDARVIGRLADGAILVLRSNQSHREEAQSATQQLQDDGIPVLGAILNDCRTAGVRFQAEYHKWDNGRD
jgi:succinoglycan biosynthesis transport protein ExoP